MGMTARSERLTRDEIVDAALAHADAGDLASLSARGLAAELGVTPMALYRHVRNKDEILTAVVDVLLERRGLPAWPSGDWRGWLEDLARSLRSLFLQHPVAIAVFTRQPVTTLAARRRLEVAVAVLGSVGFEPAAAVRVYAAVHTYTVGFCALEAARQAAARDLPPTGPDDVDEAAALIAAFVNDEQFVFGLQAMIAGIDPS
jgi:AcrR family transcriptional regulator